MAPYYPTLAPTWRRIKIRSRINQHKLIEDGVKYMSLSSLLSAILSDFGSHWTSTD